MRFLHYVLTAAALTFLAASSGHAELLHFSFTGTFDSPVGNSTVSGAPFAIDFDVPADPDNIFQNAGVVGLYATSVFTTWGSSSVFPDTYFNFITLNNGGGFYVFLPGPQPQLPLGLAIQVERGPQLFTNSALTPHFSPATINLQQYGFLFANQGPGNPGSPISNAVLSITAVPVPEPSSLGLLSGILVFGLAVRLKS